MVVIIDIGLLVCDVVFSFDGVIVYVVSCGFDFGVVVDVIDICIY